MQLRDLRFDNSFVRALPADPIAENRRRQVLEAAYSRVSPTPVAAPRALACAREVAELLELDPGACESPEFAQVFAGNLVLPGMQPYAACYGGHQFGNWAGQLGDGRAITLGEVLTQRGRRWELQLKGAGPTPYSRTADGRAVLRSSVREFLCSEAMHHLGVPTTRALCLVGTGEQVMRDMFYDGHPRFEPGAVVCRVAPSFVRFGNFEILAARKSHALLKQLADYVIDTHVPELAALPESERYLRWFERVCRQSSELVVHWMRVGFVHGVINTDNMSALGLTIDYGPYGFLEDFDPNWTPNTTDASGRRYRYAHQPDVVLWNLSCLAHALLPLVGSVPQLEAALHYCADDLAQRWSRMQHDKLGLAHGASLHAELAEELPQHLEACALDFIQFYRALADVPLAQSASDDERVAGIWPTSYQSEGEIPLDARQGLARWLQRYSFAAREAGEPAEPRKARMNAVNPKYVLRNYLAQLAIDQAEAGDPALISELLELVRKPYDEQPEREVWAEKRPEWARHRAGCSMLSCSS